MSDVRSFSVKELLIYRDSLESWCNSKWAFEKVNSGEPYYSLTKTAWCVVGEYREETLVCKTCVNVSHVFFYILN